MVQTFRRLTELIITSKRQQYNGYFLMPDDYIGGRVMVLQGPWHEEFNSVIQDDVLSLRLSHSAGWRAQPLDFLANLPNLRGIGIYDFNVKDISEIWALKNLESIALDCSLSRSGDYTLFEKLTHFLSRWSPSVESALSVPTLQHLNIDAYPYEDLEPLHALQDLRVLKIMSRKLSTLNGIEKFTKLEEIDFSYCTQLHSIDAVSEASTSIHSIWFDTCKKIGSIRPLGCLPNLRVARVTNCASISTLSPLTKCANLKELIFGDTIIQDGNLHHLLRIPRLRAALFRNRRHYSHTRSQIEDALKNRRKPSVRRMGPFGIE